MLCENCKSKIPSLATRCKRVNEALYKLGQTYHASTSAAFSDIDEALAANGFRKTFEVEGEAGNLTSFHGGAGDSKWIHISWHKMPSGRYEIVAYLN